MPRYKKVTSSPRTICCEVDAAGTIQRVLRARRARRAMVSLCLANAKLIRQTREAQAAAEEEVGRQTTRVSEVRATGAPPRTMPCRLLRRAPLRAQTALVRQMNIMQRLRNRQVQYRG